jgi:hypothetical protein
MMVRLKDEVREYIYKHIEELKDMDYTELSKELGLKELFVRSLRNVEMGIRAGTLSIKSGTDIPDVRYISLEELQSKAVNYHDLLVKWERDSRDDKKFEESMLVERQENEKILEYRKQVSHYKIAGVEEQTNFNSQSKFLLARSERDKEISRLYVDEVWSLRRLTDKFKVSLLTIRKSLVRQGVEIRAAGKPVVEGKIDNKDKPAGELSNNIETQDVLEGVLESSKATVESKLRKSKEVSNLDNKRVEEQDNKFYMDVNSDNTERAQKDVTQSTGTNTVQETVENKDIEHETVENTDREHETVENKDTTVIHETVESKDKPVVRESWKRRALSAEAEVLELQAKICSIHSCLEEIISKK